MQDELSKTKDHVIERAFAIVAIIALVALSTWSAHAHAQSATSSVTSDVAVTSMSLEDARARFVELEDATRALVQIAPDARDRYLRMRAWDAAHDARLAAIEAHRDAVCASATTCEAQAVHALLCDATRGIRAYRRRVLHHGRESDPSEMLTRRAAVAEEATRRAALGASCADLPSAEALRPRASTEEAWTTTSGQPLRLAEFAAEEEAPAPSTTRPVITLDRDDPYAHGGAAWPRPLPVITTRVRAALELEDADPYGADVPTPTTPIVLVRTQSLRAPSLDTEDPYAF